MSKDGPESPRPAAGPQFEAHSATEMLAWKREYNIRRREAQWKRRQEDALLEKQVGWELQRLDRENRLEVAREAARRKALEERVYRKHKQVESDYRNRCREAKIREREERWQKEKSDKIKAEIERARMQSKINEERLEAAKLARRRAVEAEREAHRTHLRKCQALQVVREQSLQTLEQTRKSASLARVTAIKTAPDMARHRMLHRFASRQVKCKLDEVIFTSYPSAGGVACLPEKPTIAEFWRYDTAPDHIKAEALILADKREFEAD